MKTKHMKDGQHIRQGDFGMVQITELPEGLTLNKSKVFMKGSNNNSHSYDKGELYFKDVDEFIFGYFVAGKKTKIYHVEHGKKIKNEKLKEENLVPGGIYELRKQNEDTHEGMKPVID